MNRFAAKTIGLLFVGALAGCNTTTMGTGTASSPTGTLSAAINWNAGANASDGTMTARLTDGRTFTGPFFQITQETRSDSVAPLWVGWGGGSRRWSRWGGGWDSWGPGPQNWQTFSTQYTGRVVANLAAGDGTHMRCRFDLAQPTRGMRGGGQGLCQLPDGHVIDAVFARST